VTFDIRKIEYFLAVIEHRNISRAAESLRVSQPTLSRQIHMLERQFNAPLFIRQGRGVLPTEAGKRLQEGLRRLDHQLRTLRDEVATAASEPSGEIALGIPPSPRMLLAVSIINAYRKAYPQVAIRVYEKTSGEIRDLAARGEVDLAIVNSDEPMEGLVADRLVTEPMLLVGPREAGLSLDVATPIEQLADLPLILTTKPNSLRRMVELQLKRGGLRPQVRAEVDMLPLMTDLVINGHGFTVLPSCGVYSLIKAGRISASPITGLQITWAIARPINRSLSVAARLFLGTIFQVAYELVENGGWPLAEIESNGVMGSRTAATAAPARKVSLRSKTPATATRRPQQNRANVK
jgi:LysR family transcriptional regulator, nitrogen assimilation regulatory protein